MRRKSFIYLGLLFVLFLFNLSCYGQDHFLSFTECTEDGQYIQINSDGYFYKVDINSSVDVHFNLNALATNNDIINSERVLSYKKKLPP